MGIKNTAAGEEPLSLTDVGRLLSVSPATVRNWIRLGRLTPDLGSGSFSRGYVERVLAEIRSEEGTRLKSRRNKTGAAGRIVYREYIHDPGNRLLAEEILASGPVPDERELRLVLANWAVQLFYQSRGITYGDPAVLGEFLEKSGEETIYQLILDLLGGAVPAGEDEARLRPMTGRNLRFVRGEDSLGFLYISLRDIGQRKSAGVYYTPAGVAGELIGHLAEQDPEFASRTFCDPCCGTGNFLMGLLEKGVPCGQLYGQDSDPLSVYLARISLAILEPDMTRDELAWRIVIGDTLMQSFRQEFDVIVGNPPWGGAFTGEEAEEYRRIYRTASGKSLESCDLFIERALSMAAPDGTVAFVLPEAVLTVASHGAVRKLMLEQCSFRFISYLGEAFPGVQSPSVILGIRRSDAPGVTGCRVSAGKEAYTVGSERDFGEGPVHLQVTDAEYGCLRSMRGLKGARYLRGDARFALGIVTGDNGTYISASGGEGREPVLRGSDIFRYRIGPAGHYMRFEPERFQQVAPEELYRAKEKLLYRFICEAPVFAYDDRQTLSLNSCNILIPQIPGLAVKYVMAVLNSGPAAFYLSKTFHSVKLLRSHLEQLPIPAASADVQADIVRQAEGIMEGGRIEEMYDKLDEDIMRLYGLDEEQKAVIRKALQGKNRFL